MGLKNDISIQTSVQIFVLHYNSLFYFIFYKFLFIFGYIKHLSFSLLPFLFFITDNSLVNQD